VRIALKLVAVSALTLALMVLDGRPAGADVKILDSGKVKSVKTPKKKGTRSRQNKNLFHKDPDHPANKFEPGEVLVLNPPKDFPEVVGGLGYRITESVNLDGLGLAVYRLRVPSGVTVPEAVRQLAGRFPGATIDANHAFEAQARQINARAAMGWKSAAADCGSNVRLGMIDSGVDTKQPALRGQNVRFRSFHRKGRKPGPRVHGTAVATMLVGKPKWGGLLPGAELLAASMFERKKDGSKVGTAVGLLKSLSWLAKSRVHAINLSVAGTDNKTLRMAFDKAKKKNLILVAAAGNWGRADRPAYPAAYKDVVAVTAVSAQRRIYSHANRGKYIDFAAPGVRIFTAVPGGAKSMTGTSFATPYITALLGSQIASGKRARVTTLRNTLAKATVDLGKPGRDHVFGYGFVKMKPKCR